MADSLSFEIVEVAQATQRVRQDYRRIRDQLVLALGREPTAAEMMEVAPRHIKLLQQMHDIMDSRRRKNANRVPDSLLVQIHLAKLLDES